MSDIYENNYKETLSYDAVTVQRVDSLYRNGIILGAICDGDKKTVTLIYPRVKQSAQENVKGNAR
jgi:hypothetical protein